MDQLEVPPRPLWIVRYVWLLPVFVWCVILACTCAIAGWYLWHVIGPPSHASDADRERVLSDVRSSPMAIERLGRPIESRSDTLRTYPGADFETLLYGSLHVTGPRASGRVEVQGQETDVSEWRYERFDLIVDGDGDEIDLLQGR